MSKIKEQAKIHPVIFSICYLIGMVLLKKIVVYPFLNYTEDMFLQKLSEFVVLTFEVLITFWVIYKLELQSKIRLHKEQIGTAFLWAIPGILFVFLLAYLNFDGNFWSDVPLLLIFTIDNLSIGMMEEVIVRGLLLGIMAYAWRNQRGGEIKAVFLSSFLFAIAHLGNLLNNTPNAVGSQVIYAFFLGVFFASITIKGNNLWPAIIIHSLIDFTGGISDLMLIQTEEELEKASQAVNAVSVVDIIMNLSVGLTFILFLYGVCILNIKKKENVLFTSKLKNENKTFIR